MPFYRTDSMNHLNLTPKIVRGMNHASPVKKPNEDHGLGYQNTLVSTIIKYLK